MLSRPGAVWAPAERSLGRPFECAHKKSAAPALKSGAPFEWRPFNRFKLGARKMGALCCPAAHFAKWAASSFRSRLSGRGLKLTANGEPNFGRCRWPVGGARDQRFWSLLHLIGLPSHACRLDLRPVRLLICLTFFFFFFLRFDRCLLKNLQAKRRLWESCKWTLWNSGELQWSWREPFADLAPLERRLRSAKLC